MTSKFACPKCGAPLEIPFAQEQMTCPYCHSQVALPEPILQDTRLRKLSSRAKVWGIVILLIILVPTCIASWGTIVGVLAGLIGTLVGILAPFLAN
jgi:hypothetical protein